MKVSDIQMTKEIQQVLTEVPQLVNLLEANRYEFPGKMKAWLKKGEEVLHKFNQVQTSELAAFRSRIVMAEKGLTPSQEGSKSKRKEIMKQSGLALDQGQELMQYIIRPKMEKINEARDLIRQMISVAEQLNLTNYDRKQPFSGYLHKIWQLFQQRPELQGGYTRLHGMVSYSDGLQLLAEEIRIDGQNPPNR